MATNDSERKPDEERGDEVLKRLLETPPQPKKKPKPEPPKKARRDRPKKPGR